MPVSRTRSCPCRSRREALAPSRPFLLLLPTAEQLHKSSARLLEGVAASTAKALSAVLPAPVSAALGYVGRAVGYDMPQDVAAPTIVVSKSAPTVCYARGLDSSTVLGPAAGASVAPLVGPRSLPGDEMCLATLASVPSLLDTGTISSAAAVDQVLAHYPVNPRFCKADFGAAKPTFYPTLCAKAAVPFARWRGTMHYQFHFFASPFHSARVRVSFASGRQPAEPEFGVDVPTQLVGLPEVILDVRGNCHFTVSVPFAYARDFCTKSTGQLILSVLNPLVYAGANSSVDPIGYAVYAHMGPDAQFAGFTGDCLIPASSFTSAGVAQWQPRLERGTVTVLPTGGTEGSIAAPSRSDVVAHLADVVHRPDLWLPDPVVGMSTVAVVGPHAAPQFVLGDTVAASVFEPGFQGNPSGAWDVNYPKFSVAPLSMGALQTIPTALDHFADCYAFQRGGLRLKGIGGASVDYSVPRQDAGEGALNMGAVTPGVGFPLRAASTPFGSLYWGTYGATLGSTEYMSEAEVPYLSSHAFHTTGLPRVLGDQPDSSTCTLAMFRVNAKLSIGMYRSAADDFRFMFVKGPRPSYLVTNQNVFVAPGPITPSTYWECASYA